MNAIHVDPAYYAFRVAWSAQDKVFIATCAELPSLSWRSDDPDSALTGLQCLVADVVMDMRANGEHVPEPRSAKKSDVPVTRRHLTPITGTNDIKFTR